MLEYGESTAVNYYTRIITADDTESLKFLASNFHRAPLNVSNYLQSQCRNAHGLENLFRSRPDLFFVENKRVSRSDDELDVAREAAVEFVRRKLREYNNPIHYMEFKQATIQEASDLVAAFIARFYPGEEFKHFFKYRPNIFSYHENHTVFLINVEAVRFFIKRHKLFSDNGVMHFKALRGHTGQAPPLVQEFINKTYGVQHFLNFLWENDDAFKVDDAGNVTVIDNN